MSGNRDWIFRVQDMIDNIDFIKTNLKDVDRDSFSQQDVLRRAIERSFEIIGEAARFIPQDIQQKYSDVEWSDIIGMRHKISHDYLEISPQTLWDIYNNDFFGLEKKLQTILNQEDTQS